MRISDWSSDVCSSDLPTRARVTHRSILVGLPGGAVLRPEVASVNVLHVGDRGGSTGGDVGHFGRLFGVLTGDEDEAGIRSEERRVGKACVSACSFGWSP